MQPYGVFFGTAGQNNQPILWHAKVNGMTSRPMLTFISKIGKAVNIPPPKNEVMKEISKLSQRRENSPVTILDLGFGEGQHWAAGTSLEDVQGDIEVTAVDVNKVIKFSPKLPAWVPSRVIQGSVPDDLVQFETNSYDLVMAFDLIEHLEKHNGYLLLYQMERVAKHAAFIFAPNGMVWQAPSSTNPFQAHISGWTSGEFSKLGWTVHGSIGLRSLFGAYSAPKRKGSIFLFISVLTSRIVRIFPRLAFSFVAKKYTEGFPESRNEEMS